MNYLRYIGLATLILILCGGKPAPPKIVVQIDPQTNPWTHLNLNNDPDHFQFAIVSDRTGGHRPGIFEDAVKKLNLLQPEFVMSVGDLIEGYTTDEAEIDRQRDEFGGFVQQLEMPFFYVPGNHDISNDVMAKTWRQRFGRPYYHFVYRNVLFLCLNSEDPPPTHISESQIAHISKALAENKNVRWTLVFLHRPLWVREMEENKEEIGWEKVETLLQERPYTVFAGHFHTYAKYERYNQRYFILATTGGASTLQGPIWGQFDHVVWVTMTSQGPRVANLFLEGIWDEDVRTERIAALVDPLLMGGAILSSPILTGQDTFTGATSRLRITNHADIPMKVKGSFEPNPYLHPTPDGIDLIVPPNSVELKNLELQTEQPTKVADVSPLLMNWSIGYEIPDHAPIEVKGTYRFVIDRLSECPGRKSQVVVDGQLDEWPQLPLVCRKPELIQMEPKSWQGPDDSSFRFAVEHDEKNLYVAVEVTDDQHVLDPKKFPWQQDGIEVRLDARPDPERSNGRGQGEFQDILLIALSPGETPDQMVYYNREKVPEGVQAICIKTATGHATEIAVPLTYLNDKQGEAWTRFRLNVAVDDYDEPTAPGAQIWWHPDWRASSTYAGSGTFKK